MPRHRRCRRFHLIARSRESTTKARRVCLAATWLKRRSYLRQISRIYSAFLKKLLDIVRLLARLLLPVLKIVVAKVAPINLPNINDASTQKSTRVVFSLLFPSFSIRRQICPWRGRSVSSVFILTIPVSCDSVPRYRVISRYSPSRMLSLSISHRIGISSCPIVSRCILRVINWLSQLLCRTKRYRKKKISPVLISLL